MFDTLPNDVKTAFEWPLERYQPYIDDLMARDLSAETVDAWAKDWGKLGLMIDDIYSRLFVNTTIDTTDEEAERLLTNFIENVMPGLRSADNQIKQKLLDNGLQPADFDIALRNMRADVAIFREDNLPLLSEEERIDIDYDKVNGAQTVEWDGEERTLIQMRPLFQETDRAVREKAWRLVEDRRLQDRDAYDGLWRRYMAVRGKIAANAELPDYRAYKWQAMHRMDYTPEDAESFNRAVESVVVPAASAIYRRRVGRLGIHTLRPWDTEVDPYADEPLKPYETVAQLEGTLEQIFKRVDPAFGDYFATMRREDLLDLDNRKGKAPGGYCTTFPVSGRPFIFMNGVGLHDDVQTLLHEGGHAFHAFESAKWFHSAQQEPTMEFAEVASMAMELIAAPYLTTENGGFYSEEEAARARLTHLEDIIIFWPYMSIVDSFQHWVYTHHDAATDPANCDAVWLDLWRRYMPEMHIDGLERMIENRWRRQSHIFQVPFYYIEYGLAQLGAVQVYDKARKDRAKATADYRQALGLGNTRPLPELFAQAGATLAFDGDTLKRAVGVVQETLDDLYGVLV